MNNKTCKVFVYGTLKVGGYFSRFLDQLRLSSIKATTTGKMFSVHGMYPTVNFDKNGIVVGEVHEYRNPEEAINILDRIEGCTGDKSNLFNKVSVVITKEDGTEEKVFAYSYNGSTEGFDLIENGEWNFN